MWAEDYVLRAEVQFQEVFDKNYTETFIDPLFPEYESVVKKDEFIRSIAHHRGTPDKKPCNWLFSPGRYRGLFGEMMEAA